MKISFRKTSLVDYPGKIAGTLFFPGCNLLCPWCHNRNLVLGEAFEGAVQLEDALKHLEKRRTVLGGAVLSGGEPALYGDLPDLIRRVKGLGLSVKLDTNGMEPAALERLLRNPETSPDYIALDLKSDPSRYVLWGFRASGSPENRLKTAADLIASARIPHEFRTLVFPNGLITEQDIEVLAEFADGSPWHFRLFRPGNCLDPAWDNLDPAEPAIAETLARKAAALGKQAICAETQTRSLAFFRRQE